MSNKEKLVRGKLNRTSHFTPHTSQKGITLIALIITIIVMLILVGVTINVALNGGLFTKASDASKQMQVEADRETLLSAVVAAIGYDGKVVLEDIELPTGWTGSNGTYTSPKGNTFSVDENGKVIEGTTTDSTQPKDEDLLRKYVLGDGKNPKYINEILNIGTFIFEPDKSTIADANETIKYSGTTFDSSFGYIGMRYKRNVYKIKCDIKTYEILDLIPTYTAEGNLGKYVDYAGNKWIVLRDDTSGVELIAANTTETEVTLGGSDFDTAKESYNAAVTTLINGCKDICKEEYGIEIGGNVLGIRSVGGPVEDKATSTIDFSKPFETFQPDDSFPYAEFTGKNIKIGDDNYLQDYNQMEKLGILITDNPADYWIASRFVDESSTRIYFKVYYIDGYSQLWDEEVCSVLFDGDSYYYSPLCAVRPVVTLKSGIISGATEEGTIDNPIVLN